MTTRVTRLALDVLAQAPQTVTPLPHHLPPMHFPCNWADGVEVETTFLTDVSQSDEDLAEERWALADRPVRRVRASLLAEGDKELQRLVLARTRNTRQASPAPVYSDETILTHPSSGFVGGFRTFYCDTTLRRFFLGQRILVMAPDGATQAYGLIQAIDPLYLAVSGIDVVFPVLSRVYPLIDGDILLDSIQEMLTDNVVTSDVDILEASGPNALPMSWQGSVAPFFLPSDDNGSDPNAPPIFDFEHNWGTALSFGVSRVGTRDSSGRASILTLQGQRNVYSFAIQPDALDRESAWNFLRLFEWAMGRRRSFWIKSPVSKWAYFPNSLTSTTVDIVTEGSVEDVQRSFDFVTIQTTGIDAHQIRRIVDVQQLSGRVRLTWTQPLSLVLPGLVSSVAAAHFVRFSSDSFVERWETNSICRIATDLLEVLSEEDVEIHDYPNPPSLVGAPASIPNLQFWFDATKNCYEGDGGSGLVRAKPYNQKQFNVDRVFDARLDLPDRMLLSQVPSPYLYDSASRPFLCLPRQVHRNKGNQALISPTCRFSMHNDALEPIYFTNEDKSLWSNSLGWTLFLVITPWSTNPTAGSVMSLLQVRDEFSQLMLEFAMGGDSSTANAFVQIYTAPGSAPVNGRVLFPPPRHRHTVLTVRWVPGQQVRVFINGLDPFFLGGSPPAPWQTPGSFGSLAMPVAGTTYSPAEWLTALNAPSHPRSSGALEDLWGIFPALNAVLNYQRALSISEMNAVGRHFRDKLGVGWVDIS